MIFLFFSRFKKELTAWYLVKGRDEEEEVWEEESMA